MNRYAELLAKFSKRDVPVHAAVVTEDDEDKDIPISALLARAPAIPTSATPAPSSSTPVKRLGAAAADRGRPPPPTPSPAASEAGEDGADAENEVVDLTAIKSAFKGSRAPPPCCESEDAEEDGEYDFEDGWLVYDDEEEDAEEEEEEEEEEDAAAGDSGGEGSRGDGGGSPTCAPPPPATAPRVTVIFPGGVPPPPPPPPACGHGRACAAGCALAPLRDGAAHPATGRVLLREEERLPPLSGARAAHQHGFRGRAHRDALTAALYAEYNTDVFGGALPPMGASASAAPGAGGSAAAAVAPVPVEWKGRLTKTAGLTFTSVARGGGGGGGGGAEPAGARNARVALSVTVLDTPLKLAQTLLHELCHVAAWLVDGTNRPPHGRVFNKWAAAASAAYPARRVTTCHNYAIRFKFTYACTFCAARVGRHSKSIVSGRAPCGACGGRGALVLQADGGGGAPTPARAASAYQAFCAAQRPLLARELPGLLPREAMAVLAKRWAAQKGAAAAAGGGGGAPDADIVDLTEAFSAAGL